MILLLHQIILYVLERIFLTEYKKTITINDKIRGQKLQYDINKEVAKTSALSSGKIDKYEFLTGEETLPSDQSRIV